MHAGGASRKCTSFPLKELWPNFLPEEFEVLAPSASCLRPQAHNQP